MSPDLPSLVTVIANEEKDKNKPAPPYVVFRHVPDSAMAEEQHHAVAAESTKKKINPRKSRAAKTKGE